MDNQYLTETVVIAKQRARDISAQFEIEVLRLLYSGAVDQENHNRGLLFGVALENIADSFIRSRKDKHYKNLKCF